MAKTDTKNHVLNDAARSLRRAAKLLDKVADDIKHDVIAQGSINHGLGVAEDRIKLTLKTIAAFHD